MRNDKGRRAEWELRKILEDKGYYVIRSAASHLVDLVAIASDGAVLTIEVKSTSASTLSLTHRAEKEQYAAHLTLSTRCRVVYAVRWGAGGWEWYPVPLATTCLHPGEGRPIISL